MCDTLFVRFSNMETNQATVNPPVPAAILKLRISGCMLFTIRQRYVIRIKKHLHNRNREAIIKIESNSKEYESLHP